MKPAPNGTWYDADQDGDSGVEPLHTYADDPADAMSFDDKRFWPTGFLEWFAVSQTLIPALLYLPGVQAFRAPIRIGAYAIALGGFAVWWATGARRSVHHPAKGWLIAVLVCLSAMIVHPLTNSPSAGVAQTALYFAVFSPLFWAPAFIKRRGQIARILVILLVCNGVNSIVGVLQVYDPERWMPSELSNLVTSNPTAMQVATYVGPEGRRIIRPPGLFDTPGAVCGAGTIAALLGLIFALQPFAWWRRGLALAFSLAGVSAIYLSYVRSNLVITLGMMAAYAVLLAVGGERRRLVAFAALAAGLVVVGLTFSTALGGQSITDRFATLLGEDPRGLYYASRGLQLEYGFNSLLVDYPFGAGLARWGMMRSYFGDPGHLDSSQIWAEVQPNAWILDGGWPLLSFYAAALIVTLAHQWRLLRALENSRDWFWAAAIVAANAGTVALVFSFVPFATQVGLQFWFLEGVLLGAAAARAGDR